MIISVIESTRYCRACCTHAKVRLAARTGGTMAKYLMYCLVFFSALFSYASASAADEFKVPSSTICASVNAPKELRSTACGNVLRQPNLSAATLAIAHIDRAYAEVDLHQDGAALDDFGAALKLDGSFWAAHWMRAEIYLRRQDFEAASAEWAPVVERFPRLAGLYHRYADTLDSAGKHSAALDAYGKALALGGSPKELAVLYRDRAQAYAATQPAAALADLDQSLLRDGNNWETLKARGRLQVQMGRYHDAVEDLTHAVDKGGRGDGYVGLWLYLALSFDHKDAKAELTRLGILAEAAWPGPLLAAYLGDRRPDEVALPDRSTEVERSGDRCELNFYLGELALLHGDRAKAKKLFQAALDTGIKSYVEFQAADAALRQLS